MAIIGASDSQPENDTDINRIKPSITPKQYSIGGTTLRNINTVVGTAATIETQYMPTGSNTGENPERRITKQPKMIPKCYSENT
jgi:hypothetical protein